MSAEAYAVGDYMLRGLLGAGGMSAIYLADIAGPEQRFRRRVALKLMRPDTAIRQASLLLRDEAVNLSYLDHPNLVTVHRVGTLGGRFFIEMEYIRGISLRALRDQLFIEGPPPPTDLVAALLARACDGLHSAHTQRDHEGRPLGLIHRDISPHNIMLSGQGVVKVIDFGVARSSNRTWETRPGRMVGKPAYMAPEQIAEARAQRVDLVDHRADLWAVGAVLFEMCTGRRLFRGSGLLEILEKVRGGGVGSLAEARADASPALCALYDRLMSCAQSDRPESARAVAEALREVVAEAGNRFADRASIVRYFTERDISLEPHPPRALSGMDLAWIESVRAGAPRDDTTVVEGEGDPWAALLDGRPRRDRFTVQAALEGCLERLGGLEARWFDGQDAHLDRPVRLMALAACGQASMPEVVTAALAAEVEHIRRVYPARGQLVDSGALDPGGPLALVFGRPEATLADLKGRRLPMAQRLAVLRALVRALEECRRARPDFVHGALVPRLVGLRRLDHERYEASLLGVSLGVLDPSSPTPGGSRLIGPPEGYRAPEFGAEDRPTPAMDVYAVAAMAHGLLGGDPVDAAQRIARGRPPIRLKADALDARIEGVILAAMRADPDARPTLAEIADRLGTGPADPARPAAVGAGLRAPPGQRTATTIGSRRVWLTLLELGPGERRVTLPFPELEGLAPSTLVVDIDRGADDPILRIRLTAGSVGRLPKIYRSGTILQSITLRPTAAPAHFDYGYRRGDCHRVHCHSRAFAADEPRVLEPPGLGAALALPPEARLGVSLYVVTPQTDETHVACLSIRAGGDR